MLLFQNVSSIGLQEIVGLKVISLRLIYKCLFDQLDKADDCNGAGTVLQFAVVMGRKELVRLLLEHG